MPLHLIPTVSFDANNVVLRSTQLTLSEDYRTARRICALTAMGSSNKLKMVVSESGFFYSVLLFLFWPSSVRRNC